jgi:hypothetical protein
VDAGLDILNFGHGEGGVFNAETGGALADVYEAVFVSVDERTKKNASDEREDGGVCADAQGQREHHGDRKAFGSPERTERNSQIVKE